MAHALDITDGVAAFIGRESAWHALGEATGEAFTAEDAMTRGHLGGWNVRKVPAYAHVDGQEILIPGRKTIVRDNPIRPGQIDVLGASVGDNYHIIQNEAHAEFLNNLVDESGAIFETAGSLHGGSQVFLTMRMPGHLTFGGQVDAVAPYIAAINAHDGSKSFTLMVTPIQIVCANTLNLAMQNHSNIFRIRHTSGAQNSVAKAREVLDLTFDYLDEFQEMADRMINTTLTNAHFEAILREEFGVQDDSSKHAITRSENKIEAIMELFEEADTVANKRNTVWGGLAALTEYADHYSETRGTTIDGEPDETLVNEARARKALFDPEFKQRSLELMLAVV